jgi:Flp pilus assembly protein TadD
VFDIAQIEYGRADFGLVDGKICVYEINMTPIILATSSVRFPERSEGEKIWWDTFITALHALDGQCDGDSSAMIDVGGHSIEALETAVALFPGLRAAHLTLSQTHAARGNTGEAIRVAREALAETPHDVMLLAHLRAVLAEQERFDEALTFADRVIEEKPFAADPLMARARILDRLGRHQEALAEALRAAELKPGRQPYHQFLSEVHRKLGNIDAANEAAGRAASLKPKAKRAKRRKRGKTTRRN